MRAACSVEGCKLLSDAKGYCPKHYRRWARHGDPLITTRLSPGTSLSERLDHHSEQVESGCIEWRGAVDAQGYGRLRVDGRMMLAHRAAWLVAHGGVPADKELDHTCHNPPCINVAHLRPSTKSENQQNRLGANVNSRTGIRGVMLRPSGRYSAQHKREGRTYWLGTFDTTDEARAALTAAAKVGGE